SQPLSDDGFQLAELLLAEAFGAPDDVIAFVDEKGRRKIADAELGSHWTRVLVAAHENAIVDAVALSRSSHFQNLILWRNIPFIVDANDFQPVSTVTILQVIQILDGNQTVGAPGAPEIQQHQPPLAMAEFPWLTVEIIQSKVIQGVPCQHTARN